MTVDLTGVRFTPSELVEACRRVLETPRQPGALPPGFLAASADAAAVAGTVAAFRSYAEELLDERELEVLEAARVRLPDADGATLRRAVDHVRLRNERAVEEAATRL